MCSGRSKDSMGCEWTLRWVDAVGMVTAFVHIKFDREYAMQEHPVVQLQRLSIQTPGVKPGAVFATMTCT